MRHHVAVALLIVITFLHATDAVLCPDGCTDNDSVSQSASTPEPHHASTACLLCLASLLVGPEARMAVPNWVRREPLVALTVRLTHPPSRGVDHPPRIS